MTVERFRAAAGDQGLRLDQFLAEYGASLSRTQARRIIDIGGAHVDGRRVRKAGLVLAADQRIELYRDAGPLDPFRIEDTHIVYQDDDIIVLNKPSGVETQPTPARYKGTLYEALQVLLKRDRRFGRRLEIGMAQRLDRDTSGLIVFSIHRRAHKPITEQMQSRSAGKGYLALVEGKPEPDSGTWRSALLRDRRTGIMKSVEHGGKAAITTYRVVETQAEPVPVSLLELELVTGRTHQIRAHCSEAGYPLLGDTRYGGCSESGGRRFKRHCLHSAQLEILHPQTRERLRFAAPLPEDMDLKRLFPASASF